MRLNIGLVIFIASFCCDCNAQMNNAYEQCAAFLVVQNVAPFMQVIHVDEHNNVTVANTSKMESPAYKESARLLTLKKRIYSIGAKDSPGKKGVEVFYNWSWTTQKSTNYPRHLSVVGYLWPQWGWMLFACGCSAVDDGQCKRTCEFRGEYDTSWKTMQLPTDVCIRDAAVAVYNHSAWITGGLDCAGEFTDRMISFNIRSRNWDSTGKLTTKNHAKMVHARAGHGMAVDGTTIVVCGGYRKSYYLLYCERFMTSTNEWQLLGALWHVQRYFNMFTLGPRRLVLFGGHCNHTEEDITYRPYCGIGGGEYDFYKGVYTNDRIDEKPWQIAAPVVANENGAPFGATCFEYRHKTMAIMALQQDDPTMQVIELEQNPLEQTQVVTVHNKTYDGTRRITEPESKAFGTIVVAGNRIYSIAAKETDGWRITATSVKR